jgi:hypothetical protein
MKGKVLNIISDHMNYFSDKSQIWLLMIKLFIVKIRKINYTVDHSANPGNDSCFSFFIIFFQS